MDLAQAPRSKIEENAAKYPSDLARWCPLVLVGSDLGAAGISALLAGVVPDAVRWPQATVPAALSGVPGGAAR